MYPYDPYDPYDPYSLSPHSEQNYFIQDIESLKDLGLREGSNVTALINPNDPILML